MAKSSSKTMLKFSPALGMIFGSAFGGILGLLTNSNLALTASMGTGLGLIIGTIIYSYTLHKKK